MAAAQQNRLLSFSTSKLTKLDLPTLLRKDISWILLPLETRQHLYTLLPAPRSDEPLYDPDVHPMTVPSIKNYIAEELRRFREDLKDGKETKKWREEALQAGRDRRAGKFDEWFERCREEDWGPRAESGEGGVDEDVGKDVVVRNGDVGDGANGRLKNETTDEQSETARTGQAEDGMKATNGATEEGIATRTAPEVTAFNTDVLNHEASNGSGLADQAASKVSNKNVEGDVVELKTEEHSPKDAGPAHDG